MVSYETMPVFDEADKKLIRALNTMGLDWNDARVIIALSGRPLPYKTLVKGLNLSPRIENEKTYYGLYCNNYITHKVKGEVNLVIPFIEILDKELENAKTQVRVLNEAIEYLEGYIKGTKELNEFTKGD